MTEGTEKAEGYPSIRLLTRKDRKKLSELIKAFADRSGNSGLTKMLPRAPAEGETDEGKETDVDQTYELIKSVMTGLLEWVEDDVTKWFMELIGETDQEKYDNLPFDIETHIIGQLIDQKGFSNFFFKASEIYKRVRGSIG